jgi:hypothetical protein
MLTFTYPIKTKIPSYDPEKIRNRIISDIQTLCNMYNLKLSVDLRVPFQKDLAPTDIFEEIVVNIGNDKFAGSYVIQVPEIRDGSVYIKGNQRFIEQQIRDILFVPQDGYIKILPDLDIQITCSSSGVVSVSKTGNIDLSNLFFHFMTDEDQYLIPKYEEKLFDAMVANYNGFKSQYEKGTLKVKNQKAAEWFRILYEISPVVHTLYKSPADFIYHILKWMSVAYPRTLDLSTKRVRTIEELVWCSLITPVISDILTYTYNIVRKKTYAQVIEPFYYLYHFTLMETVFESPLAVLANKFRVVITGKGGFSDNVPVSIRDIHTSQFKNIDPVTTPDKEKAGVVLFLAYSYNLDDIGRFIVDNSISLEGTDE